ncbi:MAG TPA: hypothetical protein VGZ22_02090 [Isosphaeraceae bacterium]|jgi:hypothetical protein|nr:hypothetical protein [Isosphaeraceae bacterium]
MPDIFVAETPFDPSEFPPAEKPFPIIEVFGYDRHLSTPEAQANFNARHCPFARKSCEKFRQYGYGYCSVQYRTEDDTDYEVYAVCDHRLDGVPVMAAVNDYFKSTKNVLLIDEVKLTNPSQSFDFVALDTATDDFVAIETQAIDLRGGGVGPAWAGILEGAPSKWRQLYTEEAIRDERKDNVAYGVNTANITKRLGVQIAEKCSLLASLNAKLYVVTQDRCFKYMSKRIPATWGTAPDQPWDITFISWDFTGKVLPNGQREIEQKQTKRTTTASFAEALARSTATITREEFLKKVKKKGGLS